MRSPAFTTPDAREPERLFEAARAARRTDRGAAAALYRRLLAIVPDHADARNNLGQLLLEDGDTVAATAQLRAAAALAPGLFHAHLNLGTASDARGDPAAALPHLARARRLRPDDPRAWNNIGNAQRLRGEPSQAAESLARAAALDPGDALVWNNLASAWLDSWELDRARVGLERVFALRPGFAPAVFNRGLLHFAAGNWSEGWRDYHARHAAGHGRARPFRQPAWTGGPAPDGLLVWGEQGLGDEIMFAGAYPELPPLGGDVVVETDARLVPLFRRSFPAVRVVARSDPPDGAALAVGAQIALPDLVGRLRPCAARFPARPAWLAPDAARAAGMRAALKAAAGDRPLVGLAWRSANPTTGRIRSVPAGALGPLLKSPDVAFVSLQAQETDAERAALPAPPLLRPTGIDLWQDLDGLAALIAALDLVVSIDTTVAHLAGALGLPVWVMLPANPEWRWRRRGARSLWYPSARLFRQDAPEDWPPVVAAIGAALAGMEWP